MVFSHVVSVVSVAEYEVAEKRAEAIGGVLAITDRGWQVTVAQPSGQVPLVVCDDTPREAVDLAITAMNRNLERRYVRFLEGVVG